MNAEGKSDFSMLVVFAIGLGIGWIACLCCIPNTEHYEIKLQEVRNDVHEIKSALSRHRSTQERIDYQMKWHQSRLDNHRERISDIELAIEKPEPAPEPLKLGIAK